MLRVLQAVWDKGGADLLLAALEAHPTVAGLQARACAALANLAAHDHIEAALPAPAT